MSRPPKSTGTGPFVFMSGVPLEQFLQLIEVGRKSCSIRVKSDGQEGLLHFLDGALHHARTSNLTGEVAAYQILSWEGPPQIAVRASKPHVRQTIHQPIGFLLMESCRIRDERARQE